MSTVLERSVTEHVDTDSSCVKRLSYHNRSEQLDVTFPSGQVYRYHGVPLHVWLHFNLVAELNDSLGKFFNRWIRGNYEYVRLDDGA